MPNAFDFSASPFDCLDADEQRIVRDSVDIAYFPEGETILEPGVEPTHLFVVIKGHVSQFEGDEPEVSRAAARTFPGNFLFSTGPNSQGGGKRTTRGHYDVPMRDCSIELDGRVIVKDGKIVDDAMRVARVPR